MTSVDCCSCSPCVGCLRENVVPDDLWWGDNNDYQYVNRIEHIVLTSGHGKSM